MKTVLLGARPPEVEALIARRRALGHDRFDEVWEGSYHLAPAAHSRHGIVASELRAALLPHARRAGLLASDPFNLGDRDDYRVPDGGLHRSVPDGVWVESAPVVFEVITPDDETFEKFAFCARRGVQEIIVAEPAGRSVRIFVRKGDAYEETERSPILDVSAVDIAAAIDWP